MRKRMFKKFVAALALTAMLAETGYQDYSMVANVYAAETSSGEEIEVDTSAVDSEAEAETSAEEVVTETSAEETPAAETPESGSDIQIEVAPEGTEPAIASEEPVVEALEAAEKSLRFENDRIVGEGYDEIKIEVDASTLPRLAYYGMRIYSNAYPECNGESIFDNYVKSLSSYTDELYISALDGQYFELYFDAESVSSIITDYTVDSVEDGVIKANISISDAVAAELEEAAISPDDEEVSEYGLVADAAGISGSGYDSIAVSIDYIANLVEDGEDSFSYKIYVDNDTATINGYAAADGVALTTDDSTVYVENLNGNSFVIYARAEQDENIAEPAEFSYDVVSEENGEAAITAKYTNEILSTKRVYTYEDDKVSVTATLEYADAIPDDAYFAVTPVYSTGEYLDKLNEGDSENVYTDANTLFYDIAFYTDETKSEEIEPEEGSVSIKISFKNRQLQNGIGAEEPEAVEINHFDENGDVETVNADVSVTGEQVSFETESFSVYAFSNIISNNKITIRFSGNTDVPNLDNYYLGVVGGEWDSKRVVLPIDTADYKDGEITVTINRMYDGNGNPIDYNNEWVAPKDAEQFRAVILHRYDGGTLDENFKFTDVSHLKNANTVPISLGDADTASKGGFGAGYIFNGSALNTERVITATALEPDNIDFKSALGSAVEFGLVSNIGHLECEFESNLAMGYVDGSGTLHGPRNYGAAGADYIGEYASASSGMIIEKNPVNTSNLVLYTDASNLSRMNYTGKGVDVSTKYTASDIKSKVATIVSNAASKTISLDTNAQAKGFNYSDIAYNLNDGTYVNLMGSPAGTYYINFALGEYSSVGEITLMLDENQTVIFNIPDEDVAFKKYKAKIGNTDYGLTSGDYSHDTLCQHVIFNCKNAKTARTASSCDGIFLVPNAKFSNDQVSSGWVVADEITIHWGQEFHCTWHNMPEPDPTGCKFSIKAKKTVNGQTPQWNQTFWFDLYTVDGNGNISAEPIDSKQNVGDLITFNELSYTGDYRGTQEKRSEKDPVKTVAFQYLIKERADANSTYSIDGTSYLVVVYVHTDDDVVNTIHQVRVDKYAPGVEIGGKRQSSIDWMAGAADTSSKVVFDNTTPDTPDDYTFSVTKSFKNGTWPSGDDFKFKFTLEQFDGGDANKGAGITNGPLPSKTEVWASAADPNPSFGTITVPYLSKATASTTAENNYMGYDLAGAYKGNLADGILAYRAHMYTITETIPEAVANVVGIDKTANGYSKQVAYLKLFVNYMTDGSVSIEPHMSWVNDNTVAGEHCVPWSGPIPFVNVYKPTVTPAAAQFGIKKQYLDMNSAAVAQWPAGGFTFSVTADNDAAAGKMPNPATITGVRNNNLYTFGELSFQPAETADATGVDYIYTVSETGDYNGVYKATSDYKVKINVKTEVDANGNRTATTTTTYSTDGGSTWTAYAAGDGLLFKNYKIEDKGDKAQFGVKKTFTRTAGTVWPTEGFSFEVTGDNAAAQGLMPNPATATATSEALVSFGELTFPAGTNGSYIYKVEETNKTNQQINYSTAVYYVKIDVETVITNGSKVTSVKSIQYSADNKATWQDYVAANGLAFTNSEVNYTPATAQFGVRKSFNGETWPTNGFEFTLTPDASSSPMPEGTGNKAYATSEGNVVNFGVISYEPNKTAAEYPSTSSYYYAVEETNKTDSTINYSNKKYHIRVDVKSEKASASSITASTDVYYSEDAANWSAESATWTKYVGTGSALATPEFDNTVNYGSLKVKKAVYVNDVPDTATTAEFDFKVKNAAGQYVKYVDGNPTFVAADQADVFKVTANSTEGTVLNKLPLGTYAVEEVNVDTNRFEVSYSSEAVVISTAATSEVTILNKNYNGEITVAKVASNATTYAEAVKFGGATFSLWKSDAKANPVYFNSSYEYVEASSSETGLTNQFVTSASVAVTIKKLPLGDYYLFEETAPTGYAPRTTPIKFTVTKNGTATTDTEVLRQTADGTLAIGVKNDPINVQFKLHKYEADANGAATTTPVAGAKFTLVGTNGDVTVYPSTEKTVDANGLITFTELKAGTYTLTESGVPAGYQVVAVTGAVGDTFTVNTDGTISGTGFTKNDDDSTATLNSYDGLVYNQPQEGNLLLHKVGVNGMTSMSVSLPGIKFRLKDNTGAYVKLKAVEGSQTVGNATATKCYEYDPTNGSNELVMETDANGYIYVSGLPVVPSSTYVFEEQSPYATALGYKAPVNASTEAVVTADNTATVTVENNTIEVGVSFTKVDAVTGATLRDATFELFHKGESAYATTGKTDTGEDGTISFTGLSAGEYYAIETTVPEGYEGTYNGEEYVVYFEIPETYTEGDNIELKAAQLVNGVPVISEEQGAIGRDSANGYTVKNDESKGKASLTKLKKYKTYSEGSSTEVTDAFPGVTFKLIKGSDSLWDRIFNGGVTEVNATVDSATGKYTYTGTSGNGTALVTTEDGTIEIGNLPWGEYYFVEMATEGVTDDYTLLTEQWCKDNLAFVIDGTHSEASFNSGVVNEIKEGPANLRKVDADNGNALINFEQAGFGFKFDIYTLTDSVATDKKVASDLTTVRGVLPQDVVLPYGSYYFVETEAGAGYTTDFTIDGTTYDCDNQEWCRSHLNFTISDATVKNGNNTVPVTVNVPNGHTGSGEVTINKTATYEAKPDGTGDTVEVTFALYSKENHVADATTLFSRVKAVFNNKDYWPYRSETFTLTKSASNELVYTGSHTFDNLPWDEYYIEEVSAPDGLNISTEKKVFVIGPGTRYVVNADGTQTPVSSLEYSYDYENNAAEGKAQIRKFDYQKDEIIKTGTALFDVYNATTNELVRKDIATVEGVAQVSNLQPGSYYFVETEAPEGYKCDSTIKYNFTITAGSSAVVDAVADKAIMPINDQLKREIKEGIAYNVEDPASVTIVKYKDEQKSGNEFSGVRFYLEEYDGLLSGWKPATEIKTTVGGTVKFENLFWGEYRIVEIIPDGYEIPTSSVDGLTFKAGTRTIKDTDGTEIKVDVAVSSEINLPDQCDAKFDFAADLVDAAKKAKVSLKKEDAKGRGLAGAKFDLRKQDGSLVTSVTTTTGEWNSPELNSGSYYFVETDTPVGYSRVKDSRYNDMESGIYPTCAADGFKVETVYENDGTTVKEYRYWFGISDSDLSDGKVNKNGNISSLLLKVKNERQYGNLQIKKTDEGGTALAGAEFTLTLDGVNIPVKGEAGSYVYDDHEKKDGEDYTYNYRAVTGDDGMITVTGLPTGTYTVTEVKAPKGYQMPSQTAYTVEIKYNETNTDLANAGSYIVNSTRYASISFNKKNTEGANVDGAVFELYKKGEDGKFVSQNRFGTSANGVVTISGLVAGDYYVIEKAENQSTEFGYVADETPYYFSVSFDDNGTANVSKLYTDAAYTKLLDNNTVINTPKSASMRIRKVSLTDPSKLLSGATFELLDNGAASATYITGNDGMVTINDLQIGHTYTLYETVAPAGYRLPSAIEDETERATVLTDLLNASVCSNVTAAVNTAKARVEYTFTVTSANVTGNIEVTVPNDGGSVTISKYEATGTTELPGAKLQLTDAAGNIVDSWTSGTTTHTVRNLTVGAAYTLTELEAPVGYAIAEPVTFTVTGKGVTQRIVMRDARNVGAVTLTKADASTGTALSGAVFNLYAADGTLIHTAGGSGSYTYSAATGTTALAVNIAGTLTVTELPFGEYYFREITAPAGYELSTERVYFTVSSNTDAATVTFRNSRALGRVRLTKISSTDGSALAGATFELYSKTARTAAQAIGGTLYRDVYYLYGTYVTDASGSIYVDKLPWDDYYFVETSAPAGYVISTDVNGDPLAYTFTIDAARASGSAVVDLGSITNRPAGGGDGGGVVGTTPTPTPTPTVPGDGGGVTGGTPAGGVAGARTIKGGVLSGVLGVRAKPTSGVLGVRVGPTTGDAANIALWIILLLASISVVIAICVQSGKKKKSARRS